MAVTAMLYSKIIDKKYSLEYSNRRSFKLHFKSEAHYMHIGSVGL